MTGVGITQPYCVEANDVTDSEQKEESSEHDEA